MNKNLVQILNEKLSKEELINFANNNPDEYENIIKLSISNEPSLSWRAAWIINQTMQTNDNRVIPFVKDYIFALKNKRDGHQRELMKVIKNMYVDDELEGYLFDICVSIWEDIDKIPSVRVMAFQIIANILKKYPDLKSEIIFLTQNHYVETLSPGIKMSFIKLKNEIFQSMK